MRFCHHRCKRVNGEGILSFLSDFAKKSGQRRKGLLLLFVQQKLYRCQKDHLLGKQQVGSRSSLSCSLTARASERASERQNSENDSLIFGQFFTDIRFTEKVKKYSIVFPRILMHAKLSDFFSYVRTTGVRFFFSLSSRFCGVRGTNDGYGDN